MAEKDFYNILGVKKDASTEDIKRAYRKAAHKYHPDKQGGDAAKFKKASEAYQVLSDPAKRKQYDQFGAAGVGQDAGAQAGQGYGPGGFDFSGFQGQGFDFSDIFSGSMGDIFDQFFTGGGRGRSRAKKGADLETRVELTLKEASDGTERILNLYKREKCDKCQGTGAESGKTKTCDQCQGQGQVRVTQNTMFGAFAQVTQCPKCQGEGKIPEKPCQACGGDGRVRKEKKLKVKIHAGVENGQIIKLAGEGEAGPKGGVSGDLYLGISIKEDKRFRREGDNLITELELDVFDAILGTKARIDTLDGKIDLKIPAGTQPGRVFVVKGKGVKHLRNSGNGDLLIVADVKIPTKLNPKQKKLLEELRENKKSGFWPFS